MASVQELGGYNQYAYQLRPIRNNELHEACDRRDFFSLQNILGKINLKAKIDEKNENGLTPLLLAILRKSEDCVKILIDSGADLAISDKDGWAPIHLACIYGLEKTLTWLIDKRIDLNSKNEKKDDKTPLFCALVNKQIVCAKTLIERGAEVDSCTKYGIKALSLAKNLGLKEIVDILPEEKFYHDDVLI